MSKPPIVHPEHLRPDASDHRARDGPQRLPEAVVADRSRVGAYVATVRDAIERGERGLRVPFTNARCGRSTGTCDAIRSAAVRSSRGLGAGVRARERVRRRIRNRRHATCARHAACAAVAPVVFHADQRIDGRRQRVEIAAQPAGALRLPGSAVDQMSVPRKCERLWFAIAGALDDREPALIEDLPQAGQPRVQPERDTATVGADLQHLTGGNRELRPAAVVVRSL